MAVPEIITTGPRSEAETEYLGAESEARCKLAFFEFGNLTVELISPESLPAELEAQFDKEKNGVGRHDMIFNPDRRFDLSRSLFSLGVVDWSASGSYSKLSKMGGYSLQLGVHPAEHRGHSGRAGPAALLPAVWRDAAGVP